MAWGTAFLIRPEEFTYCDLKMVCQKSSAPRSPMAHFSMNQSKLYGFGFGRTPNTMQKRSRIAILMQCMRCKGKPAVNTHRYALPPYSGLFSTLEQKEVQKIEFMLEHLTPKMVMYGRRDCLFITLQWRNHSFALTNTVYNGIKKWLYTMGTITIAKRVALSRIRMICTFFIVRLCTFCKWSYLSITRTTLSFLIGSNLDHLIDSQVSCLRKLAFY